MTVTSSDVAQLVIRTGVGSALFAHGAQKLLGWFGGGGPEGTAQYFEAVGIQPGKYSAIASGIAEGVGGAALVLGLGTPAAGAAVAGNMAVAAAQHTPKGFFNADGGFEFPALLGLIAAGFTLGGPGKLSLDHALGDVFNKPWMRGVAVVSIIPAAATIIYLQRKAQQNAPAVDDGPGDEVYE